MFRAARARLAAWNVAVVSLILTVIGLGIYAVVMTHIYSGVDQELRNQEDQDIVTIERYADAYSVLGTSAEEGYRTVIADGSGRVLWTSNCPNSLPWLMCNPSSVAMQPTSPEGIKQVLLKGREDIRTDQIAGTPYRVRTFALAVNGTPYIIQIGRPVQGEEAALHTLGFWLIVCVLLGILLAGFGGYFLATRALVPIRQAFARQRRFTADASHELRTPLALIRANAEMLARHSASLPPGDSELVNEIISETDRLNRLVGDLLTLARADAETVQIESKPIDLRELVAAVHEDLHVIAESRGIDSGLSLNGPVVVQGDEGRLRQLLLILLDNALKYTDPGGRVEVSVERVDGQARLVVADTGIGIPASDVPHIFDRFYRVDRAREHESGGTGLGLSIAQWIVQAHHGHIKVESEMGRGSRFQVDLPAS